MTELTEEAAELLRTVGLWHRREETASVMAHGEQRAHAKVLDAEFRPCFH